VAERKKTSKPEPKKQTEAKREAESKGGAKGRGGSRAASKAEEKSTSTRSAATKTAAGSKSAPKAKTEGKPKTGAKSEAKPKRQAKPRTEAKGEAEPKGEAKPKPKEKKEAPKPPVVNARARYVRVAPRKARLIANQVRGMHVDDARTLLRFSTRGAARDIAKLIDSATANAEANHDLVADDLRVADIRVDEGPTLRRYRPRALGRATRINKRTSHIQVALTPED
jgi:large subunit ribosomal protein L22